MSKFKVGDKVVLTHTYGYVTPQIGDVAVVTDVCYGHLLLSKGSLPAHTSNVETGEFHLSFLEDYVKLLKEEGMMKPTNVTTKVPYTISDFNVSVFVNGKMFNIPSTDNTYWKVRELIENGDHTVEKVEEVVDKTKKVSEMTEGRVTVKGNGVFLDGELIRNSLAERLVNLIEDGIDAKPWMRFMHNLSENPSYKSRESLFNFLDNFSAPITEDGHFIAFKRVRDNFYDIHSGTMDNSPGRIVSMPRNMVDDDSNRTCSAGLHACASIYLEGFGRWDRDRVVAVKINPRDVVAVPTDYQFSKMRVCQYEVLSEVKKEDIPAIESKSYYDVEDFDEDDDYDWAEYEYYA